MIIRWGHMSLLALLAVVTLFVAGDVRPAASQENDESSAGAGDAAAESVVTATGRFESAESLEIRCEVAGGGTVQELVPDGSRVKTGDVLVKLDESPVRREIAAAEIVVAQAQALVEQAQAHVATQDATAGTGRAILAARFEIAQLELKKYKEAGLPLAISQTESRIEFTEQQVATLGERVERMESRLEGDGEGREELAATKLELTQTRGDLEVVQLERRMLTDFEGPLQTKKLELAVLEARAALEELDRTSTASRIEAQAGLAAATAALQEAEQKLKNAQGQLEKCTMLAPRDGVVTYGVITSRRGRGSVSIPLKVGAEVRESLVLLQMPDLSKLRVLLEVDERDTPQVRVGQPVQMTAGDGQTEFTGTVAEIPEAPRFFPTPQGARVVRLVLVDLDEPVGEMNLASTVHAHIDVSESAAKNE
jgi:HlyD family secretion protein